MFKRINSGNKILFYTLLTLIAITIFMIANSYFTQLRIFQEKELFKLDCIASSLTFNMTGEDHDYLFNRYPSQDFSEVVTKDSIYAALSQRMGMAKNMNNLTTEIYTLVYDSLSNNFLFGISSSPNPIWMNRWQEFPKEIVLNYEKGGVVNKPYRDEHGTWLSAFSPITDQNGNVRAILQVDEKFDIFISKARGQIYMNISLSLIFIAFIGILMYFSVRSILKRQSKVRLEKLAVDTMRRELLANISHDLRTPLSSIYGYLETIQMKKGNLSQERIDKYLETSLKNTEKLKNLVDELFELTVLESRGKKLNFEICNLNDLINDVLNNFKLDIQQKNIEVECVLDQNAPNVLVDIALMDRVFQNIIGNSVKFCGNGDKILITTKSEGEFIHISIDDTGMGIEEKDLEHIFDRFTMGNNGETGTGLGLAIVKNILELHHSAFTISSELGKGTQFTFNLKKN